MEEKNSNISSSSSSSCQIIHAQSHKYTNMKYMNCFFVYVECRLTSARAYSTIVCIFHRFFFVYLFSFISSYMIIYTCTYVFCVRQRACVYTLCVCVRVCVFLCDCSCARHTKNIASRTEWNWSNEKFIMI